MRGSVAWVLGLVLLVHAQDKQAVQLAGRAATLAKRARGDWKRYVLDRKNFTDKALAKLIATYEQAVELFHQSLEIEENNSLNGQIVVLARRMAKLRFAQVRREAAQHPRPKPQPLPPKASQAPQPRDKTPEPAPKSAPQPPPAPEPKTGESPALWPELMETAAQQRRGKQSLRNFLMHYYFANRKFASLVTRCSRCNGHQKIPIGQNPKTRKIIFADCPRCHGTGGHLNVTNARKAFWLTMSPLHRADPQNRADFDARLNTWRNDPRKVEEFLKSLSIGSIDYHGLWAVVKYKEKGARISNNTRFTRTVQRMVLRLGKRWFLYDEKTDRDFFSPDEG